MDPNELLRAMREQVADIFEGIDRNGAVDPDAAEVLATHFDDLDRWIRKGGFLPKDWGAGLVVASDHTIRASCSTRQPEGR